MTNGYEHDAVTSLDGMPIVSVQGSPRQIGEQYGEAARSRILRSRENYAAVYQQFAGWSWERARFESESFVDAIEDFSPSSMEQIRGIAAGSGLDTLDILAINLRTEILFAGQARSLASSAKVPHECSAFTFVRDTDGRRLSAQNWDWIPFSAQTVVLLEVEQADGPNYATVVEAGILAKFGLNSAGIAVTTNALVSRADHGVPGIPYHVMLHSLITSEDIDDARRRLEFGVRSSSANYTVVDHLGNAFGAESQPGDASNITWADTTSRELTHTNHFIHHHSSRGHAEDLGPALMPDSLHRLNRIQRPSIEQAESGRLSTDEAKALLNDHDGYPNSVCCHPDPTSKPLDQGLTVAAVIIDPAEREMELCVGNPCVGSWHSLRYRERWGQGR